jgi:methionyl-tRNA formyltransferase
MQHEPSPSAQVGEPVLFKRRTPRDSDLRNAQSLEQWYDLIRMMDAQGYPKAYLDVGGFRIEFSRVGKRVTGLVADVVVRELREEDEK